MAPGNKRKPTRSKAKDKKGGNQKAPNLYSQTVGRDERIEGSGSFHQWENTTTIPSSLGYQSIYVRYKDATRRFKERLRSMVPDEIFQGDYVQSLADAVDYLHDNHTTIATDSLINDLKLAIRVRRRVAENHHEGGDEGHSYFLSTLVYCFSVLRQLTPLVKKRATPRSEEQEDGIEENRFASLSIDHDDDDDDDDETDLPSERVPKPHEPQRPSRLTLDELISGSDREAAILFLMTLDDIMAFNVLQYGELKRKLVRNTANEAPPGGLIGSILRASTFANLGIQYVQFLEEKLSLDYPHMNTICRLMAVLVFPILTEQLTTEVTEKSPIGARFKETDAIMFLGDCLEKSLRLSSDTVMRNLTAIFCDKWRIPKESVDPQYSEGISIMACMDLPVAQNREQRRLFLDHAKQCDARIEEGMWLEGMWLGHYKYIGTADRSILTTTAFLQSLSHDIQEQNVTLVFKKGSYGKSWDETRTGLAKRISHDMDELLVTEILPILINVCCGSVWQELPHQDELLPLFSLLRNFVRDPKKPISWALAFAVHTTVTSIFEVQGSNHVHSIAEEAKSCFNKYFEQLSIARKVTEDISQPSYLVESLHRMQNLRHMVDPPTLNPSREQTLRGLWNPFCAGNFLAYIAYFSNLQQGSMMIDSFAQLRMVLHLYNALKDVGLPPEDSQGFLQFLDEHFQTSKAVWEGPKPTRGNFVLRWWIASGIEVNEAKRWSNERATKCARVHNASSRVSRPRIRATARRVTPIEPGKLSKSYRRIMNRDFSDLVDKYHKTSEQRSSPLSDHAVRCLDTLDAIDEDESYLAMNMTFLGAHLNIFVDQFFHQYWKEEIEMMVRTTPDAMRFGRRDGGRVDDLERQAMGCILAREILGRLDFLDLSKPDPVVTRAMASMTSFFNQHDPASMMYFNPSKLKGKS